MKMKRIFALALATSLVLPAISALADYDYYDISYEYDDDNDDNDDSYDDLDDDDDNDDDDDDRKSSSKSETKKVLGELRKSVEANKIQYSAARLLLDEFPVTVKNVKGKLQKLIRDSENFTKLAEDSIKEL